jgi:hypothetical protein
VRLKTWLQILLFPSTWSLTSPNAWILSNSYDGLLDSYGIGKPTWVPF